MTQERLRELLRERVVEETMPDYSGRAWRAARVVRRRHRLGGAAGVVATTVGISGAIAAVDSTPPPPVKPDDRGIVAVTQQPEAPDATYRGVPIWWSPDQDQEQQLPTIDAPLPADINLDEASPVRSADISGAVAAFARGKTVVLVPRDGGPMRSVDVSRLQDATKPNGYRYFPTSTAMLTSDGERLVFPQPGDTYAVYQISTGTWSTVHTLGDDTGQVPLGLPFDVSAAQRYGENREGAQAFGMGVPLPVRDRGTMLADPEFLATDRGQVLAFMWRADSTSSRFKNCCPVAGWLGHDTVVYESRQSDALLVAWRVGTHDFRLVSRIHGAYDVASFALGTP